MAEVHLGTTASLDMRLALREGANILLRLDADQCAPAKISDCLQPVVHCIGGMVLSGGDTAAMVCDALAVETIELDG